MQCKSCKAELRWDEPRECWQCDVCYPQGEPKPKFNDGAEPEVIFEKVHENEIRRIVREEMGIVSDGNMKELMEEIPEYKNDWRGDAKALGVPLYDKERNCPRKKVDVLKDIEEKSIVDDSDKSPVE